MTSVHQSGATTFPAPQGEGCMGRMVRLWRTPIARMVIVSMLLALVLGVGAFQVLRAPTKAQAATSGCQISSAKGDVQHVIYINFDNTHFTRDNPNVPSDLEQMPNLLNFVEGNGTLLTDHHKPLISHTATDILTALTGVYGDRHGLPVAYHHRYFNPNGTSNPDGSLPYWSQHRLHP